ncbi:MAG: CDP-glycerol glycerophosphotransferase family protein [Candidatus Omnitrophota bacterium]|nr:CDP-glycerol glycerophosphotransferase family protein [Candidatus Omnitrophota bacterium]
MRDRGIILKTRERYINFISDWSGRFKYNGRNFRELFVLNNDLSYWWLSEMQKKDSESSDVFKNLYCSKAGITARTGDGSYKGYVLYYFLLKVRFLASIFLKMLVFRLFIRREDADKQWNEYVLFVSIYSNTLKYKDGRLCDRYYLDLPEKIENQLGFKTKYISFYCNSAYQLIKEIGKLKDKRIIFYERYLTIKDILGAFDIRHVLRYIFIEARRGFKESFSFEDTNVFGLFRRELRQSFIGPGISECILLSKAIERLAKRYEIKAIVTFLEMYPASRAIYYGLKRGNPMAKSIAYQHANVTPMKLWYIYHPAELLQGDDYINSMPIPDYFVFQGRMGRDLLVKSGYPEERCFLTGSPRFDSLSVAKKEEIKLKLPLDKKIILVATTYSEEDTIEIVRIVSAAAKARNDSFFIFKAHSNCPLEPILLEYGFQNYSIVNGDVHQLILSSDVLVTSYSTTADEAIALNCPSICIDTGVAVNMSTFFEIEAGPVVYNADELNSAIDMIFYHPEAFRRFKEKWPDLIEATFYKLDGKAHQRVLDMMKKFLLKGG